MAPDECARARDLPRAACRGGRETGVNAAVRLRVARSSIAWVCGIAYREAAELGVLMQAAPIARRSMLRHCTG